MGIETNGKFCETRIISIVAAAFVFFIKMCPISMSHDKQYTSIEISTAGNNVTRIINKSSFSHFIWL